MENLLADNQLNFLLRTNHLIKYREVFFARQQRKQSAFESFMGEEFKDIPKDSLKELQDKVDLFNKLLNAANMDSVKRQSLLQSVIFFQAKIDANDYATEGLNDHNYKIAYESKKNSFVWPDATELSLRQAEEAELLTIINDAN
jgi:hypothetical protein